MEVTSKGRSNQKAFNKAKISPVKTDNAFFSSKIKIQMCGKANR